MLLRQTEVVRKVRAIIFLLRSADGLVDKGRLLRYFGAQLLVHLAPSLKPAPGGDIDISVLGQQVRFKPYSGELAVILEIMQRGEYDRIPAFIARSGWTVVDVGAHIGIYSLWQGRRVGPSGTVYAFEPNPDTFHRLTFNVQENRLDWVHCYQLAVAAKPGTIAFFMAPGTGISSANPVRPLADAREVASEAVTLDDFVREHGVTKINVLKIDTEGYEVEVLTGAKSALRITDSVVLEYHSPILRDGVLSIMGQCGFVSLTPIPQDKWGLMYFSRGPDE